MQAVKNAIHRWLATDRLIGQRIVLGLAWLVQDFGNRDRGWYGAKEIPAITGSWRSLRFVPVRRTLARLSAQLDYYQDQIFSARVWQPIAGPVGNSLQPLRDPNDPGFRLGDQFLARQESRANASAVPPSFSIVTPYFRHYSYFSDCARSVARTIDRAAPMNAEWVVVNDDPSMANDRLWPLVPARIRERTRIIANPANIGNTATLNAAIAASRLEWIVFLDCDDVIAERALAILARYISIYPRCRYFSSSIVDIDDAGRILRYRTRDAKPTQLFSEGMQAGHLKAIRRDAFNALGLLDTRFDGCQDYEFALRLAMHEPICLIPEFLYGYRCHPRTQSLSGLGRQLSQAREIRQIYVSLAKEDPYASVRQNAPLIATRKA